MIATAIMLGSLLIMNAINPEIDLSQTLSEIKIFLGMFFITDALLLFKKMGE